MLIDEVLASDEMISQWPWKKGRGDLIAEFRDTFVVRSQNVWEYFNTHPFGKTPSISDFKDVAPCMPSMWFEWTQRGQNVHVSHAEGSRVASVKVGIHCAAYDLTTTDEEPSERILEGLRTTWGVHLRIGEFRWCARGLIFFKLFDYASHPEMLGLVFWGVGPNGEIIPTTESKDGFACVYNPVLRREIPPDLDLAPNFTATAEIAWLTLSFMHCKNVRVEKSPPIPEALRCARERKGKPPIFRFHTVVIDPARRVAEAGSARGVPGGAQALHICRGHFKDFGERGLFGRHNGTYWWPMHQRGSAQNGIIHKDYLVKV